MKAGPGGAGRKVRLRAELRGREWAELKWRAALTKSIFQVNAAHGVGPTGRELSAAAILELSHEAATYGRLLSLRGFF